MKIEHNIMGALYVSAVLGDGELDDDHGQAGPEGRRYIRPGPFFSQWEASVFISANETQVFLFRPMQGKASVLVSINENPSIRQAYIYVRLKPPV